MFFALGLETLYYSNKILLVWEISNDSLLMSLATPFSTTERYTLKVSCPKPNCSIPMWWYQDSEDLSVVDFGCLASEEWPVGCVKGRSAACGCLRSRAALLCPSCYSPVSSDGPEVQLSARIWSQCGPEQRPGSAVWIAEGHVRLARSHVSFCNDTGRDRTDLLLLWFAKSNTNSTGLTLQSVGRCKK